MLAVLCPKPGVDQRCLGCLEGKDLIEVKKAEQPCVEQESAAEIVDRAEHDEEPEQTCVEQETAAENK